MDPESDEGADLVISVREELADAVRATQIKRRPVSLESYERCPRLSDGFDRIQIFQIKTELQSLNVVKVPIGCKSSQTISSCGNIFIEIAQINPAGLSIHLSSISVINPKIVTAVIHDQHIKYGIIKGVLAEIKDVEVYSVSAEQLIFGQCRLCCFCPGVRLISEQFR